MNTRVVTAHLSVEVAAKPDALADSLDRPRGWLVKEAIEACLDIAEERKRETMAALAEVDAGLVVEHDELEAWASGLGGRAGARSGVNRTR